jgi:hypothetical protein
MTTSVPPRVNQSSLRVSPTMLLLLLVCATVLVTLLAPEPVESARSGPTSRSTAGGGVRMFYELAQHMGWSASERLIPFDSVVAPANDERSVQVVLRPEAPLSRAETHALLEHTRGGGGLIFDLETNGDLGDSLGLMLGIRQDVPLMARGAAGCATMPMSRTDRAFVLPPTVREFRWRRPPPGEVTRFVGQTKRNASLSYAIGFPLGAGRVVVLGASDVVTNDAIRRCEWGADIGAARALEFVRPAGVAAPTLVFDEFHHGYGSQQGSPSAITRYLSRTSSGRFLAQAMLAGLILLLSQMARPTLPHDPAQTPRRSPLEHADALANAYIDVEATKTGTEQLVHGLRRRAGRTVRVAASASDAAFLSAVAERTPALASHVQIVSRALASKVSPREFLAVGEAIREIERQLMNSPVRKS